jgi:hypothetical protein
MQRKSLRTEKQDLPETAFWNIIDKPSSIWHEANLGGHARLFG